MSFLGFLSCFTAAGTLHVLTNNNYTQELQSTEQRSLLLWCKLLQISTFTKQLFSPFLLSPLPSIPRCLSPLPQSSVCSPSGSTWQMIHFFRSSQKGNFGHRVSREVFLSSAPGSPAAVGCSPSSPRGRDHRGCGGGRGAHPGCSPP